MNNKILFSEGGQPVFLDDLKLIQDNGVSMNGALIRALTGQDGACLVEKYRYDDSGDVRTVYANAIVYDGEIIPFEDGEFSISEMMTNPDQDVYVCIGQSTTDVRTFKDGTEHNCRIGRVAFLTLEEVAANVDCFPISTLDCLADLLRDRIELPRKDNWHEVNLTIKEGWECSLSYKKLEDRWRVKLVIGVTGSPSAQLLAGEITCVATCTDIDRFPFVDRYGRRGPSLVVGSAVIQLMFDENSINLVSSADTSIVGYDDRFDLTYERDDW
ncbi:MAG: hypothetical protein IJQ05_07440 [Bacteroidaceae bacterium]|nr:hypothetical protein [Bacteroidaceae bacterium]